MLQMLVECFGICFFCLLSGCHALLSRFPASQDRLGNGLLGQFPIDQIVCRQRLSTSMGVGRGLGDLLSDAGQERLDFVELGSQLLQGFRQRGAMNQAFDRLDPLGIDSDAIEHQHDGRLDLLRLFDTTGQQAAFDIGDRRCAQRLTVTGQSPNDGLVHRGPGLSQLLQDGPDQLVLLMARFQGQSGSQGSALGHGHQPAFFGKGGERLFERGGARRRGVRARGILRSPGPLSGLLDQSRQIVEKLVR
jgi:hypothetical protein